MAMASVVQAHLHDLKGLGRRPLKAFLQRLLANTETESETGCHHRQAGVGGGSVTHGCVGLRDADAAEENV